MDNFNIIINKVKHATVNIIHLSAQDAHILLSFVDKIGGIIIFNISIVAFFFEKISCITNIFFTFATEKLKTLQQLSITTTKSNYFAYE